MLNQTTVLAIQTLLYVALQQRKGPIAPTEIAKEFGASTAYLSKINTQLAKANILRSHRGTKGGVTLEQDPNTITLLQVVEACQGVVLGDYCTPCDDMDIVCSFHMAMHELQEVIVRTLSKWTIGDLVKKPFPDASIRDQVNCRIACACRNVSE
jgi:Rrf2 family protein